MHHGSKGCDGKKISSENFSASNIESQYNVLDHSIASNPVQKGVVKAALNKSSVKDRSYSAPHEHKLLLTSKPLEKSAPQNHRYQKLDDHSSPANTSAHPQVSMPRQDSTGGDHEYHVLEEATAQNRTMSSVSAVIDTDNLIHKVADHSEHSTPFNRELAINSPHDQLLASPGYTYEVGSTMLLDGPLHSTLPLDEKTSEESSVNGRSGRDEHSTETVSSVQMDELFFDDVQEILLSGH